MKNSASILVITAILTGSIFWSAPSLARDGRTIGCYNKEYVQPKYRVKRILLKKHKQQYEHRNGRVELVDYPPVYREKRTIIKKGYYVLKPIPCT